MILRCTRSAEWLGSSECRVHRAELLIALAGPAVNFAIAAGLLPLLLLGGSELSSASMMGLFLECLVSINLFLGLFNLSRRSRWTAAAC